MKDAQPLSADILIVGAGPAGLVMALCLAKLGIGSIVVERNAGINEHPKAHELNARSIEILAMLGISLEELAVEASPPKDGCRIAFSMRINEEFGSIDLLRDIDDPEKYARHLASPLPYMNISQTEIERILLERVSANPLIDLKLEHQWQSHEDDGEYVHSVILDRRSQEEFVIRSPFLIAADGAGSSIRKALGISMAGPDKLQDVIGACFETSLRNVVQRPAKLYWVFEPDAFGTFIAHHIDKRWVYHLPIYAPWESADDYPEHVVAERIKRALGTQDIDIEIKSMSVWHMTMQIAERWRDGRVFLVGDAAHRFPPTGGLGMNTGIADAHNLAWKVSAFLRGNATDTLLDSYESERRPVALRNGQESVVNFERMFDLIDALGVPRHGAESLAKLKNNALFRALPKSWGTALMRRLNASASKKIRNKLDDPQHRLKIAEIVREQIPHFDRIGLDIGYIYEEGALICDQHAIKHTAVTQYSPEAVPGGRFPHIWLQGNSGASSCHDLMSYGCWTMLSANSSPPWADATKDLPVKSIAIDALDVDQDSKRRLRDICNIGGEGAILLRPDGHVAWRTHESVSSLSEPLSRIVEKCGVKPSACQP